MNYDIVIIGAGLSGLSLANKLEKAGHNYLLVEARNRLGGRIKTLQDGDDFFDLGPAWFWVGQPRLQKLIEHFNIPVFEQYSSGALLFEDEKSHVHHNMGFSSMQGSYRLAGGMKALIDRLADNIPQERLMLGDPVREISKDKGILLSSGKTIQNRISVLSIPPRIAADLTFTPPLSQNTVQSMQDIPTWMGGQAKFLVTYDKSFWREKGFSGDAMSRHGPLIEIHDASPFSNKLAGLFGFVGVPPQNRKNNEEALKQHALYQLARLFGEEALTPRKIFLQDWAEDAQTSSFLDQQILHMHPNYGPFKITEKNWKDCLLFCVSETASEFGGYLEGALCAAEDIFEHLNQEKE